MAARVHCHSEVYYLTGAGATPCVAWRREGERWISAPASLPAEAEGVAVEDVPDDLREELLAFATRAEVMGATAQQLGN
jgi:hypothetical protein